MSRALYSLSRKEGWRRYVDSPARQRPNHLTPVQLAVLDGEAREDYDETRHDWHANFGILRTPQLAAVTDDLDQIVATNRQDPDRVRGAAVIDALPGLGKTTIANTFARGYDRTQIRRFGPVTDDGHERLPVFRVGLTSKTTLRTLNRMICEFYGHPGTDRANAARLASYAVDCVLGCATRVGVIDDVHFINPAHKDGLDVSNHLKWLANELPVTFIYTGVGLAERRLFAEGLLGEHAALAQTGRRWTRLALPPLHVSTDEGRGHWQGLLKATERQLVLTHAQPGMLTCLADYLFARSSGHIGSFITLVTRGCYKAIRTGTERLSRDLLDTVRIDEASEQARAQLAAGFAAGTLTTARARPAARSGTGSRVASGVVTGLADARTLPLRVQIADGEALDSWLERLGRRYDMPVRQLLPVFGVGSRAVPGSLGLLHFPAAVLRRIEDQGGPAPGRLDQAVLPNLPRRWLPVIGSRFCPLCLTDAQPWPLAWRLHWTFACLVHRTVLATRCPGCRQPVRRQPGAVVLPPGFCTNRVAGRICRTDLGTTSCWELPEDDPRLHAQQWINQQLTDGTGGPAAGAMANLTDLDALAGWIRHRAQPADFTGYDGATATAFADYLVRRHRLPGKPAAERLTDPILLAAVAVRAVDLLAAVTPDEIVARLKPLLRLKSRDHDARDHRQRTPTGTYWIRTLTPARQATFLGALDPLLDPLDRLRHRTCTTRPSIPSRSTGPARSRWLPQLLWPDWTVRLTPPAARSADSLREVAVCWLLTVGRSLPGNAWTNCTPRPASTANCSPSTRNPPGSSLPPPGSHT